MKDISINISTINGTGSFSANELMSRIFFRAHFFVGSYHFFPSNIQGLPCLYNIRVNSEDHTSYQDDCDILISLNPKTFKQDIKALKPHGVCIRDKKDIKDDEEQRASVLEIPLSEEISALTKNSKLRKFLKNLVYIGMLCEYFKISEEISENVLKDFFQNKKIDKLTVEANLKAYSLGRRLASSYPLSFRINLSASKKEKPLLIDGNTAIALGALRAGCQMLSWYPITPATSIAETYEAFANRYQKDSKGLDKFISLQSEDESACFLQALGAAWAGLRSMMLTSGPGLSLIAEGAGLSYYAEVPSVLCLVQRAGPSTGLPTRTSQGDLLNSCFLSHGDTSHPVLMPGTAKECFAFSHLAFDLADKLQSLIIVLSDLDLGMNLEMSKDFDLPTKPWDRGKVLSVSDLDKRDFKRYGDPDGDGISYRVLPGADHPKAGYFTRGSGHDDQAEYTEDPRKYSSLLDKLKRKKNSILKDLPEPCIDKQDTDQAFVTFGKNHIPVNEARDHLNQKGIATSFMRVRSWPFSKEVGDFLKHHKQVQVVEQNQQGQLKLLLSQAFPDQAHKLTSLVQYDGRPFLVKNILKNQVVKNA